MIYECENRFPKSAENNAFKSRFSGGVYEWSFLLSFDFNQQQ